MLGSLHLYQLLVLLAVLVAPVVFSACYGPICGASRACEFQSCHRFLIQLPLIDIDKYYIFIDYSKSTNTTIIPVLTNVKAEKVHSTSI